MHRRTTGAVAAATAGLVLASAAFAVGPMPGLAGDVSNPGGTIRYSARQAHGRTVVFASRLRDDRRLRTVRVAAGYGVPAVTVTGQPGGLSADGRTLVLAQAPTNQGLRPASRFLVLSTAPLAVRRSVALRGEFGFDALSPDARFLYLIQHTEASDLTRYAVRVYDLRRGRLLPGVIVDKSEPGERMAGYPVARASGRDGVWIYTLYQRNGRRPFVHALNAAERYAVCINVPWAGSLDGVWDARLELARDGGRLLVRRADGSTAAAIDTASLQVVATG